MVAGQKGVPKDKIETVLHLPQKEAAKALGVSTRTLKRYFTKFKADWNLKKWPVIKQNGKKKKKTVSSQKKPCKTKQAFIARIQNCIEKCDGIANSPSPLPLVDGQSLTNYKGNFEDMGDRWTKFLFALQAHPNYAVTNIADVYCNVYMLPKMVADTLPSFCKDLVHSKSIFNTLQLDVFYNVFPKQFYVEIRKKMMNLLKSPSDMICVTEIVKIPHSNSFALLRKVYRRIDNLFCVTYYFNPEDSPEIAINGRRFSKPIQKITNNQERENHHKLTYQRLNEVLDIALSNDQLKKEALPKLEMYRDATDNASSGSVDSPCDESLVVRTNPLRSYKMNKPAHMDTTAISSFSFQSTSITNISSTNIHQQGPNNVVNGMFAFNMTHDPIQRQWPKIFEQI